MVIETLFKNQVSAYWHSSLLRLESLHSYEFTFQYSAKFRYYLTNYGSKGEDERFYLKVDSKRMPISKVMFNDDEEHSFLITSHVLHMGM